MRKSSGKSKMRYRKRVTAIAFIVLVLGIALIAGWRKLLQVEFVQGHLYGASWERIEFQRFSGELPEELLIFEKLQQVRSVGYEPIWKDYRYILTNSNGKKVVDPFSWKSTWPRWLRGKLWGGDITKQLSTGHGPHDVLFDNIVDAAYGDGYDSILYFLKVIGVPGITMKDNRFIIARKGSENDVWIDYDQIRLRDSAVSYGYNIAENEAVLHYYGFIMKRRGRRIYLPVSIETGERFEIPAKRIVIPRAIEALNWSVKEGIRYYGSREMIPVPLDPTPPEVSAKRFLDLCDVRINWDEATQQYKVAR